MGSRTGARWEEGTLHGRMKVIYRGSPAWKRRERQLVSWPGKSNRFELPIHPVRIMLGSHFCGNLGGFF